MQGNSFCKHLWFTKWMTSEIRWQYASSILQLLARFECFTVFFLYEVCISIAHEEEFANYIYQYCPPIPQFFQHVIHVFMLQLQCHHMFTIVPRTRNMAIPSELVHVANNFKNRIYINQEICLHKTIFNYPNCTIANVK